jgi:anti-sigma B factor antagonist
MYLEKRTHGDVAVIKLTGSLDSGTSRTVHADLERLIPRGGKVLLDLGKMSYLSSSGLRILLLAYRRAEAVGAAIALTQLSDEVREIMSATGFLDLFTVTGTAADGLDALAAKQLASEPKAPA